MRARLQPYSDDERDSASRGIPIQTTQGNNDRMMHSHQYGNSSNMMPDTRMAPPSTARARHQQSSDSVLAQDEHDDHGHERVNIFQHNNPTYQMPIGFHIEVPSSRPSKINNSLMRADSEYHQQRGAANPPHGHDASMPTTAGVSSTSQVFLSRAQEMKAQFGPTPSIPLGGGRKRLPEHDPENCEIKRLRVEEQWHWRDIASELNRQRIAEGKPPTFTEAAVYSRFVRNGLRIAQAVGDSEFDPKDHLYLEKKKKSGRSRSPILAARFTHNQDEALVESFAEVRSTFWEQVAELMERKTGKKFTLQDCIQRWHQI